MVKRFLLVIAGSLFMVSCGSNNTNEIQIHQIDSAVNAKAKQHDAENATKNDSILKAIEIGKADSIVKARAQYQEKRPAEKIPGAVPANAAPSQAPATDTAHRAH